MQQRRTAPARIADSGNRYLGLALMLAALGSLVAIETLHEHECTGDGCMLCLAAALAHVVLLACIGIAVVRPIVHVFARLRMTDASIWLACESHSCAVAALALARVQPTPVTMGIRLII